MPTIGRTRWSRGPSAAGLIEIHRRYFSPDRITNLQPAAATRSPLPSDDSGQDRALEPVDEGCREAGNYYFPWQLEAAVRDFVAHYNHERYHESLDNVTPADVYFGRQRDVLTERDRIKRRTMEQRRRAHRKSNAA